MRIALGGICQESHSFSPAPGTLDRFRAGYLLQGQDVLDRLGGVSHEVAGAIEAAAGHELTPAELVDGCLELIGCYEVSDATREGLVEYATQIDSRGLDTAEGRKAFGRTVAGLLTFIAATPDFQLA